MTILGRFVRCCCISLFFLGLFVGSAVSFQGLGKSGPSGAPPHSGQSATPPTGGVQANPAHAAAGMRPVARVNGTELPLGELFIRMRQIVLKGYGRVDITQEIGEKIKKEALDKLINEELSFQRAKGMGLVLPAGAVDAAVAKEVERFQGKEHFEKYLSVMGMTSDQFRQQTERQLLIERAFDKKVGEKAQITDEEMKKAFEEVKHEYAEKEKVEVSDIIFFLDANAPADLGKAKEIHRKLIGELGGDPAKLPEDPSYFVKNEVKLSPEKNPVLYAAGKKLSEIGPYSVSDVLTEGGTLHILRLTGFQPYREKSFEEVEPVLKGRILGSQRREVLNEWMADLRKDAKIEILDLKDIKL